MFCCENCFSDTYIKKRIQIKGKKGNCDFCGTLNVKVIGCDELKCAFVRMRKLFDFKEVLVPMFTDYNIDDPYENSLAKVIQHNWHIFNDGYLNQKDMAELYFRIVGLNIEDTYDEEYTPYPAEREIVYPVFYYDMVKEEASMFYDSLSESIKHKRRFFQGKFIKEVVEPECLNVSTISKYQTDFEKGKQLFRARINQSNKAYGLSDLMPPPPDLAKAGRANPNGIPFFYAADCKNTAIAEVKPWIGAKVCIAYVEAKRNLSIVDLTKKVIPSPMGYALSNKMNEYKKVLSEYSMWSLLCENLSKPLGGENVELEYLVTQYLTEYIESLGYDGIKFYSSLDEEGVNYVFFNPEDMLIKKIEEYEVRKIKVESRKIQ